MRKKIWLYVLLLVCVPVQAVLMKHAGWVPDVMLIMVVFVGVFYGEVQGAGFGLTAGFFRWCFSATAFPLGILIFPLIGAASSKLPGVFYRQNPIMQMFTVMIALFAVVAAQTFYLSVLSGNDAGMFSVISENIRQLALTVFVSPLVFAFLKVMLRVKE
ncbi:MAG: hypothetical protein ABIH74_05465 [Candidatus Omnitrophota bacterium]